MKKLRFLGIVVGVMCGWFTMLFPIQIMAEDMCIAEIYGDDGTTADGGYTIDKTLIKIGTAYREVGGSVCTLKQVAGSWVPAKIECQNIDGQLKFVEVAAHFTSNECDDCANDNAPYSNTNALLHDYGSKATCTTISGGKDCSVIFYDGNTQKGKWPGKLCMTDAVSIGKCNTASGNLEKVDSCPPGQGCKNYYRWWALGGPFYECASNTCSDGSKEGSLVCSDDDIKKCSSGNLDLIEDCKGKCAYDNENTPICTGDAINVNSCYILEGETVKAHTLDPSYKICNNDKTKIYGCTSAPNYSVLNDCSANGLKCCYNDKHVIACITDEECEMNNQTGSTVEISVSTDSQFLCKINGQDGIDTALGCIPYSMSGLAGALLPLLFGIAGGISFLLMVFGFIMVATSSGDEKKLMEARSRITSAIIGLLVSIFAIFLFRLIFSNILKIPGL